MSDSESDHLIDSDSLLEVEADSDFDDDSNYDSCYSSGSDNTTTLFSEVTNYKFENGRRYHAYSEGLYWGPNDDKQNQQLEIFHHIINLILGHKLFLAPIDVPKKVLDLGTGTGIWAIEMADKYTNSSILGNDLSPVQPTWIPANCAFEVDDFTRPWTHGPNSFDFIHARSIYGCVSEWNQLFVEVYNALIPGGWYESVEITPIFYMEGSPDGQLPKDSAVRQWCELGIKASSIAGRPLDIAGKIGGWMQRHGFVNVHEKLFKIPHGPWPKDGPMKMVGKMNVVNIHEGSEGFTLALFTRYLRWTLEQTVEFLDKVAAELRDPKQKLWLKLSVVYGQKPLNDDMQIADSDSAYFSGQGSDKPGASSVGSAAVPTASH